MFNLEDSNLSIAFSISSSGVVKESLIYPSPLSPKPFPGVTTITSSSKSNSVKLAESYPLGTFAQRYKPAFGDLISKPISSNADKSLSLRVLYI